MKQRIESMMNAREVLMRKHLDDNQPIDVAADCKLWAAAMQSTSYAQVRRAGFQDDFLMRLLKRWAQSSEPQV